MVDSPLSILFQIFYVILSNTVTTIITVFALFTQLINSLIYGIAVGGPSGVILAFLVLTPLVYFLSKFAVGSARTALTALLTLFIFFLFFSMFI